MRTHVFAVILAALALAQTGCAVGFRAGGRHEGVGAGAAIGPVNPPPPRDGAGQ